MNNGLFVFDVKGTKDTLKSSRKQDTSNTQGIKSEWNSLNKGSSLSLYKKQVNTSSLRLSNDIQKLNSIIKENSRIKPLINKKVIRTSNDLSYNVSYIENRIKENKINKDMSNNECIPCNSVPCNSVSFDLNYNDFFTNDEALSFKFDYVYNIINQIDDVDMSINRKVSILNNTYKNLLEKNKNNSIEGFNKVLKMIKYKIDSLVNSENSEK
jgi:hypothetical protein